MRWPVAGALGVAATRVRAGHTVTLTLICDIR